jgi:hypothetical protein
MIQLANDPNASRMSFRPVQNDNKGRNPEHQRKRGGHAWPFLSRHAGHPAPGAASGSTNGDSVS